MLCIFRVFLLSLWTLLPVINKTQKKGLEPPPLKLAFLSIQFSRYKYTNKPSYPSKARSFACKFSWQQKTVLKRTCVGCSTAWKRNVSRHSRFIVCDARFYLLSLLFFHSNKTLISLLRFVCKIFYGCISLFSHPSFVILYHTVA